MDSFDVESLYHEVRARFPAIAAKTDVEHILMFGELDIMFAYGWFENLANAINDEMRQGVGYATYAELFSYMSERELNGGGKVRNCIDVSFVENLFWDVPAPQCAPYWQPLPKNLKDLYLRFHGRVPMERR